MIRQDIDHVLSLGADAVQIASRFVVTKECDASDAYKRAYIEAGKGNIQIVKKSCRHAGTCRAQCIYQTG